MSIEKKKTIVETIDLTLKELENILLEYFDMPAHTKVEFRQNRGAGFNAPPVTGVTLTARK